MTRLAPFAAAMALVATAAPLGVRAATSYTATVSQYLIQTPDLGSCRLKGIDTSSDNFKYYASVSVKDVAINDGCARCIKVTKDGQTTGLTAYVLDVCTGCSAGQLKLSNTSLEALSIDANSNNATVSYKFTTCPTAFMSGTSVKACLMEGASDSYIPLQFYNAQKVVASANISGLAAKEQKDSFFFSASPNTANSNGTQWFKDVQVTLTASDGETKNGSFAFGGTTGCAMSTFQFSAASTADGDDSGSSTSSGSSGSSSTGVIVGAIAGGICALLLIVGSIFFVRRRRAAKDLDRPDEPDNQFLSPTAKPHPRSPERPTYAADTSLHNSTDDPSDHDEPDSPTMDFNDAATPPAAAAKRDAYETSNSQYMATPAAAPSPAPVPVPVPVPAPVSPQQQRQQEQERQEAIAAAAPKVAYQTYTAPQSFSFSKPVAPEPRLTSNNSFRNSSVRTAPTFPAPVLPASRSTEVDEDEGDRSSFDIDDMRESEEIKSRERFSSLANETPSSVAPYSSESAYATGHVTSPQSYVRATSLRRNSTKAPERPALRFTSTAPAPQGGSQRNLSDSLGSSGFSDRDSYASDAYGRGTAGSDALNPSTGSFREPSSSGYSRESLGILGYPYAKKPSARGSITEAQL